MYTLGEYASLRFLNSYEQIKEFRRMNEHKDFNKTCNKGMFRKRERLEDKKNL